MSCPRDLTAWITPHWIWSTIPSNLDDDDDDASRDDDVSSRSVWSVEPAARSDCPGSTAPGLAGPTVDVASEEEDDEEDDEEGDDDAPSGSAWRSNRPSV